MIVRSDPGSGKSTLVPLALMEEGEKKVILLEPRRAAALGIAVRMAELLGEEVGERVGYAVRLERRISPRTRVEVLTEALFVRRLQGGGIQEISTVIFDEFHERSVYTDLALALVRDLRSMGAEIKIVIMSATMDALKIADHLEGAAVLDSPGALYRVSTVYRPLPHRSPLGIETAAAIEGEEGRGPDSGGDTLVFLPGGREIADALKVLKGGPLAESREILPLHGSLPLSEQRRIISPPPHPGKRRIILSTNIAETSLTIPGVVKVLDTGLARVERYHLPTAMNRLSLEEISQAQADQRRGRAGRLGPGICVRLWDEALIRPGETESAIRRVDLSSPVLECLVWGVKGRRDLPWLEEPPEAAWERALELLRDLGAVDPSLNPTALGRDMLLLGLEPRLGRLCLEGLHQGRAAVACAAAAILSDRDGSGISADCDLSRRVELLRSFLEGRSPASPWIRRSLETAADLYRRLLSPGKGGRNTVSTPGLSWSPEDEASLGELLGAAFSDRLCRQGSSPGLFRMPSGRECRAEGPLASSPWLAAAEVDAGERQGYIRLASRVSDETAIQLLRNRITESLSVEWQGLKARCIKNSYAGRILLKSEHVNPERGVVEEALGVLLRERGLEVLPWEEDKAGPRHLLERIRFFKAQRGGAENWSDGALTAEGGPWLYPFIWGGDGSGRGPVLSGGDLKNALLQKLGWEEARLLDREVPEYFTVNTPRGERKKRIDYSSGGPELSLRLQDALGIRGSPAVLGAPIVFELLSPADRPIQKTADLPGFWKGSYREIRKEMRGRYPKHYWPEDPASETPP